MNLSLKLKDGPIDKNQRALKFHKLKESDIMSGSFCSEFYWLIARQKHTKNDFPNIDSVSNIDVKIK